MSFDIHPGSISTQRHVSSQTPARARSQAQAAAYPAARLAWRSGEGAGETFKSFRVVDKVSAAPISLPILSGLLRGWDAAAVLAAGLASLLLAAPDLPMAGAYYVALSFLGALVAGNALHLAGAYRIETLRRGQLAWGRVLAAWTATGLLMTLLVLLSDAAVEQNAAWLGLWFILGLFLPMLARGALAVRMDYWRKAGRLRRRAAILGAGPGGQMLMRRLGNRWDGDVVVVGLYDDRSGPLPAGWRGHAVRGNCDDLIEDIRNQRIDMVVIAATPDTQDEEALIARLRCVDVDICFCSDPYNAGRTLAGVETVGGVPLMVVERRPFRDWNGVIKEFEDRAFAAAILLLIAPVLAAIAIAIKLDSPGPVLFRQKRYGRNNQLIEVLKFRSMYQDRCDANASKLVTQGDPRVTKVGAFLRRTSLDELPQFINVLLGHMSVVGPRPHATRATAGGLLYQEAVQNYDWRHRIKPGITGWAQINGWRGETITVEQIRKRVEHDIYYIQNWSLLLDVKIIFKTIFGGFTGSKAY